MQHMQKKEKEKTGKEKDRQINLSYPRNIINRNKLSQSLKIQLTPFHSILHTNVYKPISGTVQVSTKQ